MSFISTEQQEIGGTIFETDPQRYTIIKAVGKGAFGVVVSAQDNVTGEIVAIKKIGRVFENPIAAKRVLREIKLMRHMRCPNLIGLRDIPLPRDPSDLDNIYIIAEFMDTDLHSVIQSAQVLSDKYLQYFTFQMLKGLAYMHACNVLHRDMKPTNILVKKNCELKICDLGLARVDRGITQADTNVFMTEHVVTRWYRAPEVILSWGRYTKSIDIWSAGCILAELIGRTPLFPGKNYIHQLEMITDVLGKPTEAEINMFENEKARKFMRSLPPKKKADLHELFPSASDGAIDLLSRMLLFDPNKRITAAEALNHPWISMLTREDTADQNDPYYRPPSRATADFENIEDIDSLIWEEVVDYHNELEEKMNADANPTLQLSDAVVPPTPEIIRNNSTSPGVRRANSLVKSGKGPTTPVSKGAGNGGPLQKSKNREPDESTVFSPQRAATASSVRRPSSYDQTKDNERIAASAFANSQAGASISGVSSEMMQPIQRRLSAEIHRRSNSQPNIQPNFQSALGVKPASPIDEITQARSKSLVKNTLAPAPVRSSIRKSSSGSQEMADRIAATVQRTQAPATAASSSSSLVSALRKKIGINSGY